MSEMLKIPDIIGDITIDLEQHDILLTARRNRPLLLVDGNVICGVAAFQLRQASDKTTAIVTLDESVVDAPFPLNHFNVLQMWLSDNPEQLSLRDIAIKRLSNERFCQDRQKNYYEQ